MFRLHAATLFTICLSVAPAMAQSSPLEFESDIETVTLVSGITNSDDDVDNETLLYEVTLDNRIEKVLENGLKIGGRVTLRGQRDHPARPGFSGNLGGMPGPAGAYSGLSGAEPGGDTGARGSLEAAYIELDGGLGEVRVGRDRGVASRFYEGAPSALKHSGINNAYLDPNGIKAIRTNHDLTGPSAKLSYASPRILGLRAGVSVTPDAEAGGLDRKLDSGFPQPELSQGIELAANLSRRLRGSGIRFDAAAAWSTAEVDSPAALARDSVQTFSAGGNVEVSGLEFGASWLGSDNGFQGADYTAWEIGAATGLGKLDLSLNYGESEDDLAVLSSTAFSIAAARDITEELRLAVAYQDEMLETASNKRSGRGFVVEITLSSDFLEMSGN